MTKLLTHAETDAERVEVDAERVEVHAYDDSLRR